MPFWRAARLRRLLKTEGAPRASCWRIVSEALFWSFLFPMKLGELSLPILLHRRLQVGLGRAAATLVFVRLSDLGTVVGLGALAAIPLLLAAGLEGPQTALLPLLAVLGLLALASPALLAALGVWAVRWPRLANLPLPAGLGGTDTFWLCAAGLGLWLTHGILAWLATQAVGLDVSLAAALVASSAAAIGFALPVSGFMGLGPQQVAFAAALNLSAMSWDKATLAAAAVYFVVLIGACSTALVSFLLGSTTKQEPRTGG